ncbi:MAG: hypothetical protein KC464_24620, partial [Myxococcales bacterium]|nr:hypothetical protein [Myxococcales bacterium]
VPAPTRTRRYGLTVAAVDAACMGTAFLGAIILVGEALGDDGGGSDADLGAVMLFGGAAGMFVGAPLVHRSQGNVKGAWRSLGLRLGLPLAGSLIGAAIDRGRAQSGVVTSEHTAGNLGAAGMIAALVIDWTVLAEVTEPLPVAPYVAPVRGGGYAVGLSTTF